MSNDDVFDDNFFEDNQEEIVNDAVEDLGAKTLDLSVESDVFSDSPNVPKLTGSPSKYPSEYLALIKRVQEQYQRLPHVDFDAVYDEVEKLAVKSSPTPTLQTLNDELQRIQGMKDRLVEIYVNVIKCYNTKKRCTDVLQDAWGKYSSEKNAEKRKGDAIMCVNPFIIDLIQIETLMKYCSEIMKNLDSIQETASRRVTIMQSILKIDFYSRNALPSQDFTKNNYGNMLDDSELGDLSGNRESNEDATKDAEIEEYSF